MRGPWRSLWETPRGEEEAGDPAPGIIATLQAGYERLNERPYLIAVPLALDLALWLGPRIVAPDLFNWLAHWPEQSASGQQLAETLHQRGIDALAAGLTAEVAMAVFRTGFARWIEESNDLELAAILRESFEQLKLVTARR